MYTDGVVTQEAAAIIPDSVSFYLQVLSRVSLSGYHHLK